MDSAGPSGHRASPRLYHKTVAEPVAGPDLVLVIGSSNSANSRRLCDVALRAGARAAHLLGSAANLDSEWLRGVQRVGVSAGASAPERLVQELIVRLRELGAGSVETVEVRIETEFFAVPPIADHRQTADHSFTRLPASAEVGGDW